MGQYTGKREIPLFGNYHTPLAEVVMHMNMMLDGVRIEWGTRSRRLVFVIKGEAPERARDIAEGVNTQQDAIAIAQVFVNGWKAGREHAERKPQ